MTTTPATARRGLCVLRTDQEHDHALVARLRDGDWSALDVLYRRYARTVFQRCWRILRERHVNRYWAWAVDTATPGWQNPVYLFEIDNCGPNVENVTISASVRTSGRVHIEAAPLRNGARRGYSASIGEQMAGPRYANFVLERAYSVGSIPNFGTARFNDCKVGILNGTSGNFVGNGDVAAEQFSMSSLDPPRPWPYINWPAVLTGSPDIRGHFTLTRYRAR